MTCSHLVPWLLEETWVSSIKGKAGGAEESLSLSLVLSVNRQADRPFFRRMVWFVTIPAANVNVSPLKSETITEVRKYCVKSRNDCFSFLSKLYAQCGA